MGRNPSIYLPLAGFILGACTIESTGGAANAISGNRWVAIYYDSTGNATSHSSSDSQ